ncbi:hypothetical protein BDW71DRAFT_3481 [Aspergillus fruticulosus]
MRSRSRRSNRACWTGRLGMYKGKHGSRITSFLWPRSKPSKSESCCCRSSPWSLRRWSSLRGRIRTKHRLLNRCRMLQSPEEGAGIGCRPTEERRSMEAGFEPILEKLRSKNKHKRGGNKLKTKKSGANAGPANKKRRAKGQKTLAPAQSFNLSTDVIAEAHASAALPGLTGITATKKQEVITQLIRCHQEVHAPAQGRWRGNWEMKGLETSLYNYQVLGCAFMRDRENSPEEPKGGILGDVMGVGKTF